MIPSEFWHRRLWKWDSAMLRDFICSMGCVAAVQGFGHECQGKITPHHAVKVSQGGSTIYCIGCCLAHHEEADKNTQAFLIRIKIFDQSELHQRYIEGFLETIGACNGEIILPKVQRKPKTSTRKNREKKEPYEPPWMKLREPQ